MIGPRSREQQRFGLRAPTRPRGIEQQIANGLGSRGPAGLARQQDRDTSLAERVGQHSGMRRLAHPFAALERNEAPAHQPNRP